MDGYVTIGTKIDTKNFEAQIEDLEDKLNYLEKLANSKNLAPKEGTAEYKELQADIEKTKNKIIQLRKQQEALNKYDFSSFGNSIQKVTRRIGKMALAVFGIRSAFMFVRNAINTIAADDEQLKADIDYMKSAIAYTLEPVVRGIVDLAKQLMFYIGYIVKAWTGKNIFENANKSLKNATGSAKALNKELNKTLAGFDEMNVLQDTSSSSSGGGSADVMPSFDLSQIQGEVPAWIKWIAENKNIIIPTLLGIATALGLIKLGIMGLTGATIVGLIVGLVALILTNWDKIKEKLMGAIEWLENSVETVRKFFGDQVADIYQTMITALKGVIIGFDTTINGIKKIFSGIIQFIQGVFTGDWKKAWEGVKNIFTGIFEGLKGIVISVFSFISGIVVSIAKTVGYTIGDAFKFVVNGILWAIENILNSPIRTVNRLIEVINKVPGINIGTLPTFNLPRLAKGGIVNLPGKGVPVGGALTGEVSREGVIPLTDSQQMQLLGEAIGRYITINANITNTMNGRVISRELQKVQNDSNFAFNR